MKMSSTILHLCLAFVSTKDDGWYPSSPIASAQPDENTKVSGPNAFYQCDMYKIHPPLRVDVQLFICLLYPEFITYNRTHAFLASADISIFVGRGRDLWCVRTT